MTQLDQLKQKIQELVPEVVNNQCDRCGKLADLICLKINFSDVLRTVKLIRGYYDFEIIEVLRTTFLEKLLKIWDLEKSLDDQSPAVHEFLYSLFF